MGCGKYRLLIIGNRLTLATRGIKCYTLSNTNERRSPMRKRTLSAISAEDNSGETTEAMLNVLCRRARWNRETRAIVDAERLPIMKRLATTILVMCFVFAGSVQAQMTLAPDGTYVSGKATLAPDGTYVGGGKATLAPNGKYVGGSKSTLAPDGTYVGGNKATLAPDGTYVGGTKATLAPDGSYVGAYESTRKPSGGATTRTPAKLPTQVTPTWQATEDNGDTTTIRERPLSLTPTWEATDSKGNTATIRQRP